MSSVFSTIEQGAILTTSIDNSKSQGSSIWDTNGGNNTQDKIFLLSYTEANKYFGAQYYKVYGSDKNIKSRVSPTAYAIKQGAHSLSQYRTADGASAGWWLRSPGSQQNWAIFVGLDGSVNSGAVTYDCWCVRPVLWINLDSDIF